MTLTVPAYFWPDGSTVADWANLATTAAEEPTTVILNPDSGPGASAAPEFTAAVAKVHAAGGHVIGYVHTSYTNRSLPEVEAEINRYAAFYNVDGFFIDEMTDDSASAHTHYYQSLYQYIKGLSASYSVMANPGTNIPEVYASLPTADQFVVFEGSAQQYGAYAPQAWQAGYSEDRFVHMVYSAQPWQTAPIMRYAATHGAGSVYVTSLGLPNPYYKLPADWSRLVKDARILNRIDACRPAVTLTVPAYFWPDGRTAADWSELATTAAEEPTTVILNPDSGPGRSVAPEFTAAVAKVHAAGGHVIGYVHTSYTKRSLSDVTAEINRYLSFYNVDGFFIDEMTDDSASAHTQYYQSLYHYIKGLSASYSVMANPGTNVPEVYASLPTADQFVVFEGSARQYARYVPQAWQAGYPAGRFVHMVYGAKAPQTASIMRYAETHGAGSVYVTSLGLPNPYYKLPVDWNRVVNAARTAK